VDSPELDENEGTLSMVVLQALPDKLTMPERTTLELLFQELAHGLHQAEPLQDLQEPVRSEAVDACGLVHKFT
jgi:hypothetical protein